MSHYARKVLLEKPLIVQQQIIVPDEVLALIPILNGIGNNFSQAVQKLHRNEKEWHVEISEDILKEDRLALELSTILPAVLLPSFGLHSRAHTPNWAAIVHLLSNRFRYLEDGKDIVLF